MSIVTERFMAAVLDDAHWIALILLVMVTVCLVWRFEGQYRADKAKLREAKRARPPVRCEIQYPESPCRRAVREALDDDRRHA